MCVWREYKARARKRKSLCAGNGKPQLHAGIDCIRTVPHAGHVVHFEAAVGHVARRSQPPRVRVRHLEFSALVEVGARSFEVRGPVQVHKLTRRPEHLPMLDAQALVFRTKIVNLETDSVRAGYPRTNATHELLQRQAVARGLARTVRQNEHRHYTPSHAGRSACVRGACRAGV